MKKKLLITQLLDTAYKQRVNNLQKSIETAQKALTLSKEINNLHFIGKSLSKLALFYMIRGEHQESIKLSKQSITYFKKLNDEGGIADAKYNIAGVYYKTNNYHLGMLYLLECLRTYRKLKDYHNESKTQKTLGGVYEILGDQVSAIEAYNAAIKTAKQIQNKNLESNAYNPLSGIMLKMGNPEKAMNIIDKSIAIKKETGDRRGFAFAVYGRAKVCMYLKEYEIAEKEFLQALGIHKEFGEHLGTGMAYHKLAQLWIKMGKRKEAISTLKKAIKFSSLNDLSLIKYKCNYFLYEIYKEDGKKTKALLHLEEYLKEKDATINSQTMRVIENYELVSKVKSMEQKVNLQKEKAELQLQQERSEQSAKMKQEFLSSMSHEIRTPLNAVTGIISLLQEYSTKEQEKLLTSLSFSAKNLMRIINNILDFSKLDSNKMNLDIHAVDIKELLNNTKDTYTSLAVDKGLELTLRIDPKISDYYWLDETRLFQILGNLLSNAIKYTQEGYIKMEVTLIGQKKHLDILRFSVLDTGVGIAKKEVKKLFESFYISRSITTKQSEGTGLGLPIVKKLVALHGSSIQIETSEGSGSRFYFDLELQKSPTLIKADNDVFEILNGKQAILAEDNEINTMVIQRLLQKYGVKIHHAENGKKVIALAKKKAVDFILMDIHMPKINGFDATYTIRTSENPNKNTPIFALTADITSINEEKYTHLFNGFLWKPIQLDRLLNILAESQKTIVKPA